MKKIVILLLSVLLLGSCSSFFKASAEGVPVWFVYETALPGQKSFKAKGEGNNRYEASLNAYNHIIDEIQAFLGKNISETLYHQFITSKTISAFSLSVEKEEIQNLETGKLVCYVQVLGNLQRLTKAKDDSLKEQEKLNQEIGNLISQADSLYRENKDMSAVKTYLQAAEKAYGKTFLDESHQYKVIIDRAVLIISSMNLTLLDYDSSALTAKVTLSRKNLLRNSLVQDAYIRSTFEAINAQAQRYETYNDYYTGTTGLVRYDNTSNGIVSEGKITFSLVLDQELEAIGKLGDKESYQKLKEAVEASKVSFSYKRQSRYSQKLGVCIVQYDLNGDPTSSTSLSQAIIELLSKEGIEATLVRLEPVHDPEEIFNQLDPDVEPFILYGSVGCSLAQKSEVAGYVVTANFTLNLLDTQEKKVITSTGNWGASTSDSSLVLAQEKALELYVNSINPTLKSWLF